MTSIIHTEDKNICISISIDTLYKWNLSTYQYDKIINEVYCFYCHSLKEKKNSKIKLGVKIE